MKLQQLRYIWEVARHDLNVSATAQSLYTSQPGISKQIRLLEDELGVEIFARSGKNLTRITPAGEKILELAADVLQKTKQIKQISQEFNSQEKGCLTLATTHTQARYILPKAINTFSNTYPDVSLQMQQGNPLQVSKMAADGLADFAIATEAMESFSQLIMLPCYLWSHSVVVPKNHPLARNQCLELKDLLDYPLVTYVLGFTGRSRVDDAFKLLEKKPKVVFTAVDSDVIKTYVRLGMGVGIIASKAYEEQFDPDLVCLDASHLFAQSTTWIGFRRGVFWREYMYDFIKEFAPHLTPEIIDQVQEATNIQQRQEIFAKLDLPVR